MDFLINRLMSVPLSPHFTSVEKVLPKFKDQEQEESMSSTEWLKKIALKSAVTCMGRIHVRTQKTVTKPNGGSQSLGKTSDEVLKKRNPSLS